MVHKGLAWSRISSNNLQEVDSWQFLVDQNPVEYDSHLVADTMAKVCTDWTIATQIDQAIMNGDWNGP